MSESTLRILIVEDSPDDARLVLHELKQAGFNPEFTRVETEAEFRAHLEQVPDVVLCDYNLPQFNALRALEILTERRPDVPFVIVSGSIGEDTAVEAMRRGASDYLLKDRLGRLGSAVTQALEQRKLREAARRAQDALKASEEQYRSLAESIPQMVWTARPNGDIDYINRRTLEYGGRTFEGLVGFAWESGIHPDDLPRSRLSWGAAIQTGEPQEVECRIRRADGEYRWHIVRQVAVRDQNGSIVRWFGTCTDIHKQKQTEESFKLFRALLDHSNDAVEVIDPDTGRFLDMNQRGCDRLGYSREEILLLGVADIDSRVAQRGWAKATEELRRTGNLVVETQHQRKDGTVFPVEVNSKLVKMDHDYVVAVVRDITERKRIEEERLEAEKALRLRDRAIQAASQGILITDPNQPGNPIIYASPAFERLTGYPATETIGRNCRFLQGKDTDPATVAVVREAIRDGLSLLG